MPTNLTGSDLTPFFDADVAAPDEGEEITAATAGAGKGPVRPGLQGARNREATLHAAELYQSLVPRVRLSASNTGSTIYLSLPGRVAILTGAGVRYFCAGSEEGLITPLLLKPAAAASWPANSLLYLYAVASSITAGLIAYEVWTTAPDAGLMFKADAPGTHRYLGCFFTGTATSPPGDATLPLPFSANRGVYRLVTPRVVALARSAPYLAIPLAGYVPPHARVGYFTVKAIGDTTGAQEIYMRSGGCAATTAGTLVAAAPGVAAGTFGIWGSIEMPLFDGVEYKTDAPSTTNPLIDISGWTE